MDRGGVDSAPWRPALVSVRRSASYLNVSRRLVRWMKQIHPGVHWLEFVKCCDIYMAHGPWVYTLHSDEKSKLVQ